MDRQELYDYILDNLQYRLEKTETREGIKWCYQLEDYSGRDFYKNIPIEYLEDDRIESLEEEIFSDYEYEYDKQDDEDDWEEFHEVFEEVFYDLVDENVGR